MQIHRWTRPFNSPMICFLLLWIQLWISRIAAASREHGMKYPVLVHNLAKVSSITSFFFVYSAVVFMNTKYSPSLCAYRAACNSTDVLSARWRSQNPAHSSHLQNWHKRGERKVSWQHWVTAKSPTGSFLVYLYHVKGLCGYYSCYVLLAMVLQIFLKTFHTHAWFRCCVRLSLSYQHLRRCNSS